MSSSDHRLGSGGQQHLSVEVCVKEPAGDRDAEAAEARVRCCEKRESQGKKTLRLQSSRINKFSRGTPFRVQNISDRFCALVITKTKGQSNSEKVCTELPNGCSSNIFDRKGTQQEAREDV